MRLKSLILCSMSIATMAIFASPSRARAAQDDVPAQNAEPVPNAAEAARVDAADAGQDAGVVAQQAAADAGQDAGVVAQGPQQPGDAGVAAEEDYSQYENYEGFSEEVIVVGLQRSMQQAQTVKRNSDQIVDSVVAQDIGKLPDVTVSETAARIPGVQVNRERGEAAGQVLVRGLPDVTTTYNGREIFTAETRSVALADFPSGAIASLSVFKSTTAEQIEGGLAGLIDVRSRRPFDFEGFEINAAARGTYANQSGMLDPNANLLITNRWQTGLGEVGALVNFSYSRLNYLDSARWNSGNIGTATAADSGLEFRRPDVVGIFYGAGQRERPSVNGAVQWRPQAGLELYVEGLWQGYRDSVSDRILEMRLGGGRFTNVTLRPDTTDQAQSLTVENGPRPFMFQGATFRETNTYQLAVGGSYEVGAVKITADVARTDSRFNLSLLSFDQELATSPTFDVNFDVPRGPGGMEFNLRDFDLTDPANFRYVGFFDRSYVAAGDDWQFRTDADVTTGFTYIPKVEFGFRYTTRDAYQENGQRYCAPDDGGETGGPCAPLGGRPVSELPVDTEVFRPGFRGAGDIQSTRTWVSPTYDSIRGNVEQLRALQGFNPGDPVRRRLFDANEQTFSWYGQTRYEFKLGAMPVDGVVGVRAVSTNTSVTQSTTQTVTQTGNGRYFDLLPNASARIRFIPDLHLRLSANQTRTRPGFDQLRPTILDSPPPCLSQPNPDASCQIRGGGGNPDLKPVLSNNYDASLEYYFLQTGQAALAVFRRDIDGFITNLDVTQDHPLYGPGRVRVNIPVNGGEGRIQGFEATLGTFFDFLPGVLSGFGAQANVTYLDDQQAFPRGFQLELGEAGQIPNVSAWSYNLVAMYEREGLSARLAYNQRSRWITAYVQNPLGEGFTGEYVDGVSRLDFSASYAPFSAKALKDLTFTFDASNILGTPFRNFRQFTPEGDTYPRDVRYEESIFGLGVRFRI